MKFKLQFIEQDHLFKAVSIIGLDFVKENTINSIIDSRKHMVRRRRSEEEETEFHIFHHDIIYEI